MEEGWKCSIMAEYAEMEKVEVDKGLNVSKQVLSLRSSTIIKRSESRRRTAQQNCVVFYRGSTLSRKRKTEKGRGKVRICGKL